MSDTTQKMRDPLLPSGRFVLRIDPGLHAALRQAARESGTSLNEYCARKLAVPTSGLSGLAGEVVARAAALAGDALLGVVVFGSWSRRELSERSDVDLLIVVGDQIEIGRWLYRKWDEAPLSWDSHPVEPHFVHLPQPRARMSGTWAEVAVDGIVLYDRDLTVSKLLVDVRQQILSGRLVRRRVHGQSYWVEAA